MLQLVAGALPGFVLEKRAESFLSSWREIMELPLAVELWNGKRFEFSGAPKVLLRLMRPSALMKLARPTLDSLGEAYVEGEIDIEGHVRDVFEVTTNLVSRFSDGIVHRIRPPAVRHSRKLDAASIEHHYDVSNEFYAKWLDERMVYSCAYFRDEADSLEAAQVQKIDHILNKIRLQPGEQLLDIGCGWGALVIRAAQKYGARCVGITLSHRQHELAAQRVKEAGLADRVEIRLQDYRDVPGVFDKITSVGMFEHVGLKNLRAYFKRVHALLRDGGVVMNHGITSTDPESGETPFGGGRFIDRYVFPNGELPHIGLALQEMSAAGLEATDVENLRLHYARTLDHWSDRFETHGVRLREIAGEQRYRIWRVYLAGCAYAFRNNWLALHQIVGVKTDRPERHPLPLTRDYMYVAH